MRASRAPAFEPRPGIARPRAVIDSATSDLTELAVINDVDPELGLLARHVRDSLAQSLLIGLLVERAALKLGLVDLDERWWPWQTAGVASQNAMNAALHVLFLPNPLFVGELDRILVKLETARKPV